MVSFCAGARSPVAPELGARSPREQRRSSGDQPSRCADTREGPPASRQVSSSKLQDMSPIILYHIFCTEDSIRKRSSSWKLAVSASATKGVCVSCWCSHGMLTGDLTGLSATHWSR